MKENTNSYIVIKDIPFISSLKVGAIITPIGKSVYNVTLNGVESRIIISGFDCSSKEYFKPYVAPKFAIGEYVLTRISRKAKKKSICRVVKFLPNRRIYIVAVMPGIVSFEIDNRKFEQIEVSESDMSKTYIYWFINSEGKASPAAVGQSKDRDLWCKASGNMFNSATEATEHARKVIASNDCEILIDTK